MNELSKSKDSLFWIIFFSFNLTSSFNLVFFKQVKVYLINEESNQVIEYETMPRKTSFLTDVYGTVKDDATGTITKYNYDYTGFTFKIGTELLYTDNNQKRVKYSVIVGYKDRIFAGTQILKGIESAKKYKAEKVVVNGNGKREYILFGEQDELQIIVKRDREKQTIG